MVESTRLHALQPTLRPAIASDARRVADLLIDTRAAFMPYAPSPHADAELRAWVATALLPAGGVTLADVAGCTVGAMAVEAADAAGTAWITQMAVDPACVGRGVGSALLAQALHVLPRPLRLWTFQANGGARRFYARHGFDEIELTDGRANEERCPDVLMERAAP